MEQIRSFIAIELPAALKRELGRLQGQLKSSQPSGVRWVDPDSIHLTLKFLGNIAADRTGEISGAMTEAGRGIAPFRLEVKGLGVFPNPKRVQVAWVGLGGQIDQLSRLQQRLESNLAQLGFAPEKRPFASHLTLARMRHQVTTAERQSFGQLITDSQFEAGTFEVSAISLMKSQLTRAGAIHSRISSAKLKEIA